MWQKYFIHLKPWWRKENTKETSFLSLSVFQYTELKKDLPACTEPFSCLSLKRREVGYRRKATETPEHRWTILMNSVIGWNARSQHPRTFKGDGYKYLYFYKSSLMLTIKNKKRTKLTSKCEVTGIWKRGKEKKRDEDGDTQDTGKNYSAAREPSAEPLASFTDNIQALYLLRGGVIARASRAFCLWKCRF